MKVLTVQLSSFTYIVLSFDFIHHWFIMMIEMVIAFLNIQAQEIVCNISNWTEIDPTGFKTSKWTEQSLKHASCCEQGLQEKVLKQ